MIKRNTRPSRQKLEKGQACYVLITCDKPASNGCMQVNMTYEGDAALASYLIQGAQSLMDEQVEDELSSFEEQIRLVK